MLAYFVISVWILAQKLSVLISRDRFDASIHSQGNLLPAKRVVNHDQVPIIMMFCGYRPPCCLAIRPFCCFVTVICDLWFRFFNFDASFIECVGFTSKQNWKTRLKTRFT